MLPPLSVARSVSPPDRPVHAWERTGGPQDRPPSAEVNSGLPPDVWMLPSACGAVTNSRPWPSWMIDGSPRPPEPGISTGQLNPLCGRFCSGLPGVHDVVAAATVRASRCADSRPARGVWVTGGIPLVKAATSSRPPATAVSHATRARPRRNSDRREYPGPLMIVLLDLRGGQAESPAASAE